MKTSYQKEVGIVSVECVVSRTGRIHSSLITKLGPTPVESVTKADKVLLKLQGPTRKTRLQDY